MNFNTFWFRRRFLEGRFGHSYYLMFGLILTNFVVIVYRFLFEQISNDFFSSLYEFVIIFVICYLPTSIIIGYWHRHTQLQVENTIKRLEDPLTAHICRVILDLRTGKASEKEVMELKRLLARIEKS